MVQVMEGKVGTVYYCPLDNGTYEVTGEHSAARVTDPDKVASGQDVRISNWRNFSVENDGSGRPAGEPPPKVLLGLPPPQPVGGDSSSGGKNVDNGQGAGGPTGGGRKPANMPQQLWQYTVDAAAKTGMDPYVLTAQMERESSFGAGLHGSPSDGDGLMQVEPGTRSAYAAKFRQQIGHDYDHDNPRDQVLLAAVIMTDKGGSTWNQLVKYNGGDNWHPGSRDSYGREIHAEDYASSVMARADQMRTGG